MLEHAYIQWPIELTVLRHSASHAHSAGGLDYYNVQTYINEGYLAEADVRRAATNLFAARMKLGILDMPEAQPFQIDALQHLDSAFHRQLSYEAAQQGMVLLKNDNKVLPLAAAALTGIAVIGPNADNPDVLYGNYQGTPPYLITPRMGLELALPSAVITYTPGCYNVACANQSGFAAAIAAANNASINAIVAIMGIDQTQEAEGHDRFNISLPGQQTPLIQQLSSIAKRRGIPFVLGLINGGPLAITWEMQNVDAILEVGYASQSTGSAFADILLGKYSPAGKLAVTWPATETDLPPFPEMAMAPNATAGTPGRTYRYSTATPLLPFGHGLTYSTWSFTGLGLPDTINPCADLPIAVTVTNTGGVDSGEVVQVYVSIDNQDDPLAPLVSLAAFERVFVAAGATTTLNFTIAPRNYAAVNESAAATFGQQFAVPDEEFGSVVSGSAFGLSRDYHTEAISNGAGPIGWDDMFQVRPGAVRIWVGSGQQGYAPGILGETIISGSQPVNLAECDIAMRATRQ